MPRQDTRLEAEGAEFLVLGQLLIKGIPAYKTYTNLPGYDLVATWPETNKSARIQVKSRWATDANAFLIKKFDCEFVVLVRLNRGNRFSGIAKQMLAKADPEFYVLSAKDAKALTLVKGWSKILWNEKAFQPHRRRWDIVRQFLKEPLESKKAKRAAKAKI